ncbi:hypothetical protein DFQ01_13328 [Paenibacillus cellulosilyticus]|uniref:Uncharacterized protein n=1 Tax=Paenibacillus cellulosilyticus TaxID=375489 RepID=A0A2V2YL93_9BACL|nr:DUF6483 family protein [Paenibacillus cellulosilyticus]PWV94241.1 hypothetical protein DFQ01_13328 [Paenibacillus cellulosilyticus]QKS44266.1 hypothetical protein HUB94_07400 [Paenibacillus cellulosilyticus]
MLQRDYMMRLIESMTDTLGQMMGLRKQQKQEEALALSGDLLEKLLRMKPELARKLSAGDLISMLGQRGTADPEDLRALGTLMSAEADTLEELGRESEAVSLRAKALHMHLAAEVEEQAHVSVLAEELGITAAALETEDQTDSDQSVKSDEAALLMERLGNAKLPRSTGLLAAAAAENRGWFDKAENYLYAMYEDGVGRSSDLQDFYTRLMLLTDEQLESGGLPREELELGLAELDRMKE